MSLSVVRTVPEIRSSIAEVRSRNLLVGLVPTMGALHDGHASLIERARAECGYVAVTIFVNPLQFGPNEDYLRYPRPFDKDLETCKRMGADLVFAPEVSELYASPQETFIEVGRLGDHLCGPFRPGHFRGVATVVAKLFNIVQADRAYFGEKDYQQLCIIRRMVSDLNFAVSIVPVPILREPDGLALSSRNVYLAKDERAAAPILYGTLEAAKRMIEDGGERNPVAVKLVADRLLASAPLIRSEYFEIVDAAAADVQPVSTITGDVCIALAAWIGKTRLIDNIAAVAKR